MSVDRIGLYRQLTPYQNQRELIKRYQDTEDIIKQILGKHARYASEYDKISQRFWAGDALSTARELFRFCKANIRYKIEPESSQSVMSPSAILYKGSGDCKHYASFINGVMDSLKRSGYPIKSVYRFASYRFFDPTPQHVFAVLIYQGKEFFVDPVLHEFNEQKKYFFKKDKSMPMSLYSISGVSEPIEYIGYADVIESIGRTKRPKKKGGILKKAKQRFLKVSLFASRNSFLLLVKLNTFHLATKMWAAMKKPGGTEKIKSSWEKVGGNWARLNAAIKQGVNTYNKLHKKKKISGYNGDLMYGVYEAPNGELGAVQFAAAAAIIAAAMPIIAKLMSMLKGAGVNTNEMNAQGAAAANEVADQVADQQSGNTAKTQRVVNAIKATGMAVTAAAAALKTNPDGSQTLSIDTEDQAAPGNDVSGQSLQVRRTPSGGAPAVTDSLNNAWETVKQFVIDHKKPILITTGVVAAILIVPRLIPAKGGRRRR